jgi:hypothetical protein
LRFKSQVTLIQVIGLVSARDYTGNTLFSQFKRDEQEVKNYLEGVAQSLRQKGFG